MSLILMNLGILAFVILYARWIYQSAYNLDKKWIRKDTASYSAIHRTLQFLVFFGCAWLLIRWVSECFRSTTTNRQGSTRSISISSGIRRSKAAHPVRGYQR